MSLYRKHLSTERGCLSNLPRRLLRGDNSTYLSFQRCVQTQSKSGVVAAEDDCRPYAKMSVIVEERSKGVNEEGCLDSNGIYVEISARRLQLEAITNRAKDTTCGAVSTFIGTTRDNFDKKVVTKLEYEAYTTMALREMYKVGESVKTKWPDVVKTVYSHRVGVVPVMEASIIIAVSSPHRKSAIEAVHFSIDELKARVPIWKKEIYDEPTLEPAWKKNEGQARS